MIYLLREKQVDHLRLISRINSNIHKLMPFSTVAEALAAISTVYNIKVQGPNRVYWDTDFKRDFPSQTRGVRLKKRPTTR